MNFLIVRVTPASSFLSHQFRHCLVVASWFPRAIIRLVGVENVTMLAEQPPRFLSALIFDLIQFHAPFSRSIKIESPHEPKLNITRRKHPLSNLGDYSICPILCKHSQGKQTLSYVFLGSKAQQNKDVPQLRWEARKTT